MKFKSKLVFNLFLFIYLSFGMYIAVNVGMTTDELPNHNIGMLNIEAIKDILGFNDNGYSDLEKFPCIRLSYEALQEGGSFPIVLNIANDTAVTSFLNKHIQFNDIPRLIENALNKHTFIKEPNMKNIFELSHWTENYVHNQIAAIA